MMKVLIVNTDYPEFLKKLYKDPNLKKLSYNEQLKVRNDSLFGCSDFYSYNLQQLGCEVIDIHYNNVILQMQWIKDYKPELIKKAKKKLRLFYLTNLNFVKAIGSRIFRKKPFPNRDFFDFVLEEQINGFNPSIILNQSIYEVFPESFKVVNKKKTLLIGQIASSLPNDTILKYYDYLISSLPNFIEKFTTLKVPNYYSQLAFESNILSRIPEPVDRDISVLFVGSITAEHSERAKLLEYLCHHTNIEIWGELNDLPKHSVLYKHYKGPAWGRDMYSLFRRAKVVINHHISIAGDYANNMRLYEATGCGALLITDHKKNIDDIFKIDNEVVTFSSKEECLEKINFYLKHESERAAIAKAGQDRTLTKHSYKERTKELKSLFETLLQNTLYSAPKEYETAN